MCSVDLCGDVARREGYPCGMGRQRGGLEPATPSEVLWESRTSSWPAAFEGSHGAATAWVERAAAARVSNCRSRRSISRHGRGGARALAHARPSRGSRSSLGAFPPARDAAHGRAPAVAMADDPKRARRRPLRALEDALTGARRPRGVLARLSLVDVSVACGDHAGTKRWAAPKRVEDQSSGPDAARRSHELALL